MFNRTLKIAHSRHIQMIKIELGQKYLCFISTEQLDYRRFLLNRITRMVITFRTNRVQNERHIKHRFTDFTDFQLRPIFSIACGFARNSPYFLSPVIVFNVYSLYYHNKLYLVGKIVLA